MPVVIDPNAYIIGAADVYYRAIADRDLGPWLSVGGTEGDIVFRIQQTFFNPSEGFNGLKELIREMDYLSKQRAEAEFTMLEVAGAKLALAVPGATVTATAATDAGGTPLSTTLAAAAAIGDVNVKVVAITNAALGDWIRVDVTAGGLAEYRRLTFIGTAGAGGSGLGFRDPLLRAHASGVAAVEAIGDGKNVITGTTTRRLPLTAYNDYAMVGQSPTGYYELILLNGISQTESAELTFGNEAAAGIRATIASRAEGATPNTPSWQLRVPPA